MRNNEERLGIQQKFVADVPTQVLQSTNNLNFIVPTELVDLPSKGDFYPPNHPLRGKDAIEIKQMTAKEEDILTNRSLLKKGVALEKLLESIIVEKTLDPEELLICDRNAIFLAARISAYGPEYKTQIVCPACEKKTKYEFDLSEKLEVDSEFKTPSLTENGTFIVQLPASKWVVECRPLNGADEKRLINSLTTKKDKEEITLLDQLSMFVVSVQGVTDPVSIKAALESLPAKDSRYLRKEYDSVVPTLQIKNNFVCPACEYEEVLEVPLTADFFWPK